MKKALKIILIILAVFIGLVILIVIINPAGNKNEQEQTQGQNVNQPAVFKVTAQQIMKEYEQNELAADKKYKDKIIEVSGIIGSIDKEITGKPFVTIKSGEYDIFSVQCLFERNEGDSLLNLSKGNSITVKGKVQGKLGNILLVECQIVK